MILYPIIINAVIDLIKSGISHVWFYVDFIKKVLSLMFKYLKSIILKGYNMTTVVNSVRNLFM